MIRRHSRLILSALAVVLGLVASATTGGAASAHGFTSVVYAEIATGDRPGHVAVSLELEYDLLVVSAADAERNDPLFQDGTEAFQFGDADDQARALEAYDDTVLQYVADRFTVTSGDEVCALARDGDVEITVREGVPYAVIGFDAACTSPGSAHVVTSTLFGDDEGYVRDTKTILTYDIDAHSGSAALDAASPTFSTEQSLATRFGEFFLLGAEHLLTGADHILFLLALIAGSRRLREVVLAATAFTVAHSVTFILAATGVVSAPAALIEPVIALSISIVGAWHLWGLWRSGKAAPELDSKSGPLGIDRAGWLRLAVVFVFGLVHGLGFASALGIDEPWSWTLLGSLLVFNIGVEVVQIAIIALVFPLIVLLRRRVPTVGLWATGALAVSVTAAGLLWFFERILGQ
ncbi:HupE/UreJ family protein [Microbacterium timonense]|uniref:HupE/UreJ family protein n=1 Tax=Microbacterium timonense TaxID=2086576 RepID=UPI000D1088D7|nr:HupE/UreJ family protein [Microbacterium timonense]